MKAGWRNAGLLAVLAVSSCGPSEREIARRQAVQNQDSSARAAVQKCRADYPRDQRTRENAVPAAKCYLAAQLMFSNYNSIFLTFRYKNVAISEKFKAGLIGQADYDYLLQQSLDEAQRLVAEQAAQQRIVNAQEAQAKAIECAVAQQRSANTDRSGLNSTSGAVAIFSLIGAIADGVSTAAACR